MYILTEISDNIIQGNANLVKDKVSEALNIGVLPLTILNEGLIAGLDIVGENFKARRIFVPNLLLSARAMNMGVKILEPLLKTDESPIIGKVIIGSVEGDMHDIGKNLVKFMLTTSGFKVIDLGVDVSEEKFVQSVKKEKPDILAMSALLTSTMLEFREVIKALVRAGLRNQTKIMVGGACVQPKFAEKMGADAYAADAMHAVEIARRFVQP